MKKNKKGFVLAEVLVALVVVGVVMALSVQTFKIIKTSYTPLTYFSFKNIRSIVFLLTATVMSDETTTLCKNSNGELVRVLLPDGYTPSGTIPLCSSLPGGTGSSVVCNKIANDIINSAKATSTCSNLYSVNTSTSEPTIANLNPDAPTFRTMNGQRYYVTNNVSKATAGADFEYGYRLIAVDLNGKRGPNTASTANQPPDIVTFLIMDNGDVYPLGVAADNYTTSDNKHVNYIASSVKGYCYPRIVQDDSGQNVANFSHCPLTSAAYVPKECVAKVSSGVISTCYYKIEKPSNILSYRNAFCTIVGNLATAGATSYKTYCNSAGMVEFRKVCPPFKEGPDGTGFDMCLMENIKPMFRFNFD